MESRARRRDELYQHLGDLPDRSRRVSGVKTGEEERPTYILETLLLDLNGVEAVPAYYVRPREVAGRRPAVLYNHAHGGDYALGKKEFIEGRDILQKPPYAEALAERGYCALCIDAWGFGDRSDRSESALFKRMLWSGQVLWGMMVFDGLRALDYLGSRTDVDGARIATLGMSMGSTLAWWLAALDERVKVCVDLCCLTDFQALLEADRLDAHGLYYYVPGLLKHFTTAGINALIAPRAHLSLAGRKDPLTPAEGLDRIDRELRRVYEAEGVPEAWQLRRFDSGHQETPAMREAALSFLDHWL